MVIVRSQNRNVLVEAKNIQFVETKDSEFLLTNRFSDKTSTGLGKYATKERCLEVLDMIQGYINGFEWSMARVQSDGDMNYWSSPVFEMPLE